MDYMYWNDLGVKMQFIIFLLLFFILGLFCLFFFVVVNQIIRDEIVIFSGNIIWKLNNFGCVEWSKVEKLKIGNIFKNYFKRQVIWVMF